MVSPKIHVLWIVPELFLPVSPGGIFPLRSFLLLVKDIKHQLEEELNKTIFDMWMACYTQEEIAEAVKMAQQTIADRLKVLPNLESFPKSVKLSALYQDDFSPPIYNVWAFGKKTNEVYLGWTQEKIARAYDVRQQMVSFRINLHTLPDEVKSFTNQNMITETQLIQILPLQINLYFQPWLTTDQIRLLCARDMVRDRVPEIDAKTTEYRFHNQF